MSRTSAQRVRQIKVDTIERRYLPTLMASRDDATLHHGENQNKGAYCVVSSRSPYRIVSLSSEFASLLQFSEHELLGRSLAILYGPQTDALILRNAIKAIDTNPQGNVDVRLYRRNGDSRRCIASFAAALDCDGEAIGCAITVRAQEEGQEAMPLVPDITLTRQSNCPSSPCIHLPEQRVHGMNRLRHNLYVGLLLESEASGITPTVAARLQEDALLCQLLAAVSEWRTGSATGAALLPKS